MSKNITCPKCGWQEIYLELRDAEGPNPPRNSYGEWCVCPSCRHEWRGDDLDEEWSSGPPMVWSGEGPAQKPA
jgi:hypothetical protein